MNVYCLTKSWSFGAPATCKKMTLDFSLHLQRSWWTQTRFQITRDAFPSKKWWFLSWFRGDDRNQADGDGCSSTCQVELGYTCSRSDSAHADVCHGQQPIFTEDFSASTFDLEGHMLIFKPAPEGSEHRGKYEMCNMAMISKFLFPACAFITQLIATESFPPAKASSPCWTRYIQMFPPQQLKSWRSSRMTTAWRWTCPRPSPFLAVRGGGSMWTLMATGTSLEIGW